MPVEELAVEDPDDLLVPHLEVHGIVKYLLALLVVTGVVVMPGAIVIALVLVRLAEGKAEVDLFAGR